MPRKIEFDILKGLLIISVVIGHVGCIFPAFDVYWFHMPSFFIVSGYFHKRMPSLLVVVGGGNVLRSSVLTSIKRYVIPYLAFCLLMFILFRSESPIKFCGRTLYGGLLNITWFTYPYWFINCLFLSVICMTVLDLVKPIWKATILIGFWIVVHLPFYSQLPYPFPFAMECVPIALVYMTLGTMFRNYNYQSWHNVMYVIVICMIVLSGMSLVSYRLDIAGKVINHPILDLIIPCAFFWCLWRFSLFISLIPLLRNVFATIGECCMTIFFIHAACINLLKEHFFPIWAQIAIAILLGTLLHFVLRHYKYTRIFFIGKSSQKKEYVIDCFKRE